MRQRWVFTETELDHPSKCKSTDQFTVYAPTLPDVGVLVNRCGKCLGEYGDGNKEITAEHIEIAEFERTFVQHDAKFNQTLAMIWRDVNTDQSGSFLGFAGYLEKNPPKP